MKLKNICKNQANSDKYLKSIQFQKLVIHETLDPNPINKFIMSQFKNVNFKNLSKQKKKLPNKRIEIKFDRKKKIIKESEIET